MIGSTKSLTKKTKNITHLSVKKSQRIAKGVQKTQKAVARYVRSSVSGTTNTVISGTVGGYFDKKKESHNRK